MTHFWPHAASGGMRVAIVAGALAFLVAVNVVGIRAAARTGVSLSIAKILPLLIFIGLGAMHVDLSMAAPSAGPLPMGDLGQAALLLLFAMPDSRTCPRPPANTAIRDAMSRSRCCR